MAKSPTLVKMLKNFTRDLKKFVQAGAPVVDRFQYEDRIKTCLSCEHLQRNKRCGLCGCVVEVKATWQTAECPDGRWDKKPHHGRKSNTDKPSE